MSDKVVVNPIYPQKPNLYSQKRQSTNSNLYVVSLRLVTQNYITNVIGFELANYNRNTKKFTYKTFIGGKSTSQGEHLSFTENKNKNCAYQVRVICEVNGWRYYSAWSNSTVPKW